MELRCSSKDSLCNPAGSSGAEVALEVVLIVRRQPRCSVPARSRDPECTKLGRGMTWGEAAPAAKGADKLKAICLLHSRGIRALRKDKEAQGLIT